MQNHSWDDLKYLLAIHRAGTVAQAARLLGVNETTVSRRLKVLSESLAAALVSRDGSGLYRTTELARHLIEHAERIEKEHHALLETVGRASQKLAGNVRISAVPIVVNKILVPQLRRLQDLHPFLNVELVPESRNIDLTTREADLALRLARPDTGGLSIKASKIGLLRFGVFGPASGPAPGHWIGYDESHAHLPQAKWLQALKGLERSSLRVADAQTALEAVAAGLGVSLLPRLAALRDPRLRELSSDLSPSGTSRPVWLLSHRDQSERLSLAAAKEWLMSIPWDGDD